MALARRTILSHPFGREFIYIDVHQRRVSITRAVVPQNQSLPDVVAAVREDRAMVAWLRERGAPVLFVDDWAELPALVERELADSDVVLPF